MGTATRRVRPDAQEELGEVDVETWDVIRSRRNVRSYTGQAIAPEDLDRVLEAARRTPSAGNQQAWDFVVCTDPSPVRRRRSRWWPRPPRTPAGAT